MIVYSLKFPWIRKLTREEEYSLAFRGTPFEKEIALKSIGELAELLQHADVRNDFVKKKVIDYTINLKLVRVQTKATMQSGWINAVFAVVSAISGYMVANLTNMTTQVDNCECECKIAHPEEPAMNGVVGLEICKKSKDGHAEKPNGTPKP